MTRVLVTGGAGFIGSHLTDRLLADGCDVTVLDNLSTGLGTNIAEKATFVEGDVGDRGTVDNVFAEQMFDAVCHIAGQASIRVSFAEPEVDLRTNVVGNRERAASVPRARRPKIGARELDDRLRRARPGPHS